MKKTVLALLVVLLLGTFVACNGEVDFLLWENEETETRALKLKIWDGDTSNYSFAQGESVSEKTFYINASVETWADLINSYTITIYTGDSYSTPVVLTCVYDSYLETSFNNGNLWFWMGYMPETEEVSSEITYYIYHTTNS